MTAQPRQENPQLNLNTVLLTVVLALGGWTLTRVSALSEQMAVNAEKSITLNISIAELRTRVTAVEVGLQILKMDALKSKQQ